MLEFPFIDGGWDREKSLMLFNRDFDALSSTRIRRSLIRLMESRNQIKIPPQSMIYVIGKGMSCVCASGASCLYDVFLIK